MFEDGSILALLVGCSRVRWAASTLSLGFKGGLVRSRVGSIRPLHRMLTKGLVRICMVWQHLPLAKVVGRGWSFLVLTAFSPS